MRERVSEAIILIDQIVKILLLNQVFYPDVVATAQYLTDLAGALTARGHEVTVVSSRRAYEYPETLYTPRERWQGVNIIRVASTRFGKRANWRRAADFASFLISCCARLLFLPRHDIVVALTTPPLISFIGAWRAKLWRAKFCYWVMDFNPDEAIAAGWLNADSFAAKFLERLSRFSLRRADKIIALDRFMRDRIVAKDIPAEKIAVVPPWSHDREVRPDAAGAEEFRALHGLQGKFVVMYSGNHSPVHPLDTLMQAAEKLREEKNITFTFVGGGSEFAMIKQWAAGNPQVLCLPYQPLNKLSASLSAANLHVVVMGSAMLGLVHPCKIYNILAVGAPVIYIGPKPSHITEIFDLLPSYPRASVQPGEVEILAQHIQRLAANRPTLSPVLPQTAMAAFSQTALVSKLITAIEPTPPAARINA
jgi:glycosyltransferase involved in cell wall biosynthesis